MLNRGRQPEIPSYGPDGVSLYYNQVRYPTTFSRKLGSGIARTLRLGSVHDLQANKQPGKKGLQSYIRTSLGSSSIPFYVFDEHNHAIFGWREAAEEGRIARGALLIHFDAHDDAWAKPLSLNAKVRDIKLDPLSPLPTLAEIAELAHECDINGFIAPALDMGLISDVWWVDPRFDRVEVHPGYHNEEGVWHIPLTRMGIDYVLWALERYGKSPLLTISDCDLDFFKTIKRRTPQEQRCLEIMNQVMRQSGAVTCATSPGFIGQQRAISLAKRLVRL